MRSVFILVYDVNEVMCEEWEITENTRQNITSKSGVHFSLFMDGTEKLVGCLTEVEIVIFKLVFSLYVSKDITECLLALSHWLLLHRRNFWGVSEQRLFLSSNTYFRRILNKCSVVSKLNKGRLPFGILRFPLDVGFHILLVTQETS